MKTKTNCLSHVGHQPSLITTILLCLFLGYPAYSDVLFEDTFDRGLTGWTAIQPEGSIAGGGPMAWYYDANRGGFSEGSNIYYDAAAFSATATAVMLINDTLVDDELIFTARLNAGDDDGFGLIFGYKETTNFYRVMFGVQDRFNPDTGFGFPGTGWRVERKHPGGPPQAGNTDVLFGNGTEDFTPDDQTFLVTRGQPFIVTISVSSENKLTLTILDNPDDPEKSVEYLLVDNQDLPSLSGGQVGLTSWGMSGGNPSGFLASDLSLDDFNDPLVNAEPADILGDWTVVTNVSGRTDGSNALNAPPNWGIPVGAGNQSRNALVESSNALGGNDGPGQVDFTAGTIVAGVSSWKDYIMTTRITPRDDDGFGIILRYRDPANFYRIAFRGQPSGTGVQQGISVQKVVNGVYEQIFHDASQYIAADPPDNLALDVIATIEGNTLDIRVIEDVNGAANVFNYGPIEITGGTVDSGKIGFFSWAMGGVDFHSVRVDSLSSGVPLLEDNFERTLAGWTSVQPFGPILNGPLRWYYDEIRKGFTENSNIHFDASAFSKTATDVMLINDTVAPNELTYKARLNTGDNDGFGLIFGYQDDQNFYRITFAIQDRKGVGFPWVDWHIDRKVDGLVQDLFGNNTPDYEQTFVPTAGRDFDATITVSADNKLTFTLVDDPGNPDFEMSYVLVEDQELPDPAGGKVGIHSWGQSGTVAGTHSFLITNLSLDPTPLVNGAPTSNLGDWTLAIPVSREDESNSLNILPNWGFPVGKDNQSFNTLVESSNGLGGNDAEGTVDFVAGGLVAGVSSWTDYRMTTRMIAGDDDGFGVYLRYKDAANFYRIAFRSQDNATTGVPEGVSVQKAVDGFYEEVLVEVVGDDDGFQPTTGQPFDLAASITGNELNIRIVDNPDVSPQSFVYNPIEILEPTVDSGKVGVWSWAMGQVQFDSVKVDNLAGGVSLEVSSSFGNPDPPVGINSFEEGVEISASADAVVEDPDIPNVRRILTGFTGSGSVPATGTVSPVTFNLGRFSSLNWQYRSEFRVATTSTAGGSVSRTGEDREWINPDDAINLVAVADPNFIFDGWSGKSISENPNLSITATGPIILTAHFTADSDGDGLADDWEQANYGDLSANPGGDSDQDGPTNLEEFQRGTDPNFSESSVGGAQLVASNWENVQRDPRAPGKWIVKDFGDGYRGAWENSNDHIGADVTGGPRPNFPEEFSAANASFDGPRLIVRDDVWNSDWDNEFVLQATLVVADNDGNCLYFRYQDEENWYRVTINGLDSPAPWRPHRGSLSVQMKEDGVYYDLARDIGISTGPANDTEAYNFKQVLLTVEANGSDFVVKAVGWEMTDLVDNPPAYDPFTEVIIEFSDEAHATGRAGIGDWGQGGGSAVPGIPVDAGMMYNDFTITVGGEKVLSEDWSEAPLGSDLPEGWENPFADGAVLKGNWQVSAHGSIVQMSDGLTSTTGTLVSPRADGEGPVLLAPAGESSNFLLEIGFHPFDNNGIGFVYDFLDADNYAKVVFSNQASAGAGMPQGVNISRKSNGMWSDILVADRSFIYNTLSPDLQQVRPFGQARPFAVEFVHNNGDYRMLVWDMDDPSQTASFTWNDQLIGSGNRNGLHTWGSTEAHFLYFRTSNFPAAAVGEPSITGVNLQGDQLVLEVSIPGGQPYSVDVNPDLQSGRWTPIATDQTGSKVSINISTLGDQAFFRLRQN